MVSPEFEAAAEATKKFTTRPSNDDLLKLYALFKIAKGEEPASKGGLFDPTNKAKYNKWDELKNKEGKTAEEAEKEYIALVEEFKTTYKYDENKVPE